MDDATWERYAAFGGIAFVALNVVGAFLPGQPPKTDDSAAKIAKYYADNAGRIQVASFLAGLGIIGLLWWFGTVWRRMSSAENERPRMAIVAAVGLAGAMALALTSFSLNSLIALERHTLVGDGAKYFFILTQVLLGASGFGLVAHIAAVTSLSYRHKMFPQWINILGWLAALGFLIASIAIASDAAWLGIVGLIAFLVWSLWVLVISVMLLRPATVAAAPA